MSAGGSVGCSARQITRGSNRQRGNLSLPSCAFRRASDYGGRRSNPPSTHSATGKLFSPQLWPSWSAPRIRGTTPRHRTWHCCDRTSWRMIFTGSADRYVCPQSPRGYSQVRSDIASVALGLSGRPGDVCPRFTHLNPLGGRRSEKLSTFSSKICALWGAVLLLMVLSDRSVASRVWLRGSHLGCHPLHLQLVLSVSAQTAACRKWGLLNSRCAHLTRLATRSDLGTTCLFAV